MSRVRTPSPAPLPRYVVPIKDGVRKAEGLSQGDVIRVELAIRLDPMQQRRATKPTRKADTEETFDVDRPPGDWR